MEFNPLSIQKEVNAHCSFNEVNIKKADSKEMVLEKLQYHQKWLIDHAYEEVNMIDNIIREHHLKE